MQFPLNKSETSIKHFAGVIILDVINFVLFFKQFENN